MNKKKKLCFWILIWEIIIILESDNLAKSKSEFYLKIQKMNLPNFLVESTNI